MFDPTIYENLKVVLEGAIYDLDFAKEIHVINRSDTIDLANMSREFSMQFKTTTDNNDCPIAEVRLRSTLQDFATEKIEQDEKVAGCFFDIFLFTTIQNVTNDCDKIEKKLMQIWQNRPIISQSISFSYGNEQILTDKISIRFGRKINEDQIEDFEQLLSYTLQSLQFLEDYFN
ncbi:hypothetical protein [Alkalihalobacterium chitinilyticum]|uniref:Uncharacterized protein n=1 Tax=Alkalihalobacterium chitinilyticum TaxID=2980103 RepID=A0ABT5VML5_9BACI|nr:hypothetical protein [Alkalihalobacterium chitinilyticum]MDE5415514.1 hypothetical protein [Alkalihalobacterium chitinilyticum]